MAAAGTTEIELLESTQQLKHFDMRELLKLHDFCAAHIRMKATFWQPRVLEASTQLVEASFGQAKQMRPHGPGWCICPACELARTNVWYEGETTDALKTVQLVESELIWRNGADEHL